MTAVESDRARTRVEPRTAVRPVAVLMMRFPSVTETFILREMIEMERQGQPVRLVSVLKESPPVVHDAARPWIPRALYTPYVSGAIMAANIRAITRHPWRYLSLLARLIAGTAARPVTLLKTLMIFPKSVRVAEQLEAEGVRHIHAHYATFTATMCLIIATLTDITFSFTVHAHDIQVDRSLLRWKLRKARFVRSISDFNRRFLREQYPGERTDIEVIHVGIETENYESTAPLATTSAAIPRILCVAAHKPYKGLPVLIEACGILRDAGVAFRCEVVGHGPMHRQLERMIRDRQLGDSVELVGPRTQDEVAKMMAASTLFVLPSIIAPDGQMEGVPVALMEAMASGRAVVSTAISGIPELVDDGVNGLLVAPGDAKSLANAMRTLLADRRTAREMGLRGREKVRREFTLRDCVAALLARLARENEGAR